MYGLVAQSIETDEARDYALFHLDPRARFADGSPITSTDIRFTFDLLKTKGRPQRRSAYTLVKSIETPDAETIRFDFPGLNDRELPLILRADAGPLAATTTDAADFDTASFAIPLGSGPYKIAEVDPGQKLILKAQHALLGEKPAEPAQASSTSTRSRSIITRDPNSLFEALQRRARRRPLRERPATLGDELRPAGRPGASHCVEIVCRSAAPKGMDGFVFNTRRGFLQRRPRARGARHGVRFRMDQCQSFRRPLHSHQELLRQFDLYVDWTAGEPRRTGALETVSRRCHDPTFSKASGGRRRPTARDMTGSGRAAR